MIWGLITAAGLTALLSGVAGIGGGTILIAVLYGSGIAPSLAISVHAIVQLISNGTRTIAYAKDVEWRSAAWFILGALPAPFFIAPFIAELNPHILRIIMGCFVLLALFPHVLSKLKLHGTFGIFMGGVVTTSVGMFIGASGTIIGPWFARPQWHKTTVIGTLAMCQAIGHLLKIIAFLSINPRFLLETWRLWLPMGIAVILGTVIARFSVDYLPEKYFLLFFKLILLVLSFKLFYDGLTGFLH